LLFYANPGLKSSGYAIFMCGVHGNCLKMLENFVVKIEMPI